MLTRMTINKVQAMIGYFKDFDFFHYVFQKGKNEMTEQIV